MAKQRGLPLDVRMRELSGIETFDRLRARKPNHPAPVIFLTGHGDISMAVDSVKNGAFDFFEKPFNDNRLVDRVAQALRESGHRLQLADSAQQQQELVAAPHFGAGNE